MSTVAESQIALCLAMTQAISRTRTVEEIYDIALDALADGLGVVRASILLFDADGVMRFKAFRQLSESYRAAVDGHSPWTPDSPDPTPIVIADIAEDESLTSLRPVFEAEGIAGLAFIPLVSRGRVIGKFMLYFDAPRQMVGDELQLAMLIASQVAFAVERTRAEDLARRNEQRLRFALDAASMGTWDWDLITNQLQWSDNLERIHGLPPGTFDGTFASYEREVHPDDRERVLASTRRALAEGVPHEVEYRIVAPDGTVRWVEGHGRVEFEGGRPIRMSGVCMIVTRRKEAELARLAAAEEASRLRDEFLATLSHELRTPLNAILGWVQMVQGGGLPPERQRHAVEVIARNARLQAQLIEDILDVSRIITGRIDIEPEDVSVSQLVENVVAGMLPAAQAKKIALTLDVPDGLPSVWGDPKRLHQVLGNVISNAIKFTPDSGRVDVCCQLDDGSLAIEVRDAGVGIDPAFLPYVFERFRQADSRSTRRSGGLGLGLAIARHLVEQHGGRISASSEGTGTGTTVRMSLPIRPREGASAPASATASRDEDPCNELRLEGATVVVVDDQHDSRELVSLLFEQCGATVVRCVSAAEALDALGHGPVDLLVADIAMPDVDGYELIAQVRNRRHRTPAIAVSAYARPQDRARALSSGYQGYCAKPLDTQAFLEQVREILRRG
jgi:PAS domain S-box-containing protein